jgi:hypothetical protein
MEFAELGKNAVVICPKEMSETAKAAATRRLIDGILIV